MINEEKQKSLFALDNARRWCKAVTVESDRILELNTEIISLFQKMRDFTSFNSNDRQRMDHTSDMSRLEEYYFVIALNKALEWLIECKLYFNEMQDIINRINIELPYIREARNMREHEIEYYKNKGRKQEDFVRPLGAEGQSIADATSTIVNEEGYFVGGRLSVQKSNAIFNEIYKELEILKEAQWRM
ncbi:hypothetical protein OB236_39670 [Paenibacillus sp. WQ 127069]|uniref:Uncharacterized protein n=1 Tax=Paenibacillus baimaensis TaxID=2982185 RepID=A0ABT2UUE0_9BACL|nr:hypothetical protein [Paenibacillus sp. WQ 127069]MCU6798265.1 hypothetical protein [Paenibacillus sp. WQ 127069]